MPLSPLKFAILALLSTPILVGCAGNDLLTSKNTVPDSKIYLPYVLPEGLLKMKFSRNDKGELTSEFVGLEYRPDAEHQYFLEYDHSRFAKDEITIEITSEGYLKSITAKSKDESGEFIKKVVELATEVGKAVVGVKGGQKLPEFSYEVAFDPTDEDEVKELVKTLDSYGVEVWSADYEQLGKFSAPATASSPGATCNGGACYRQAQPFTFTIVYSDKPTLKNKSPTPTEKSVLLNLPNKSPVLSIALNRYSFVESNTKVTFNDGMLTKVELTKPSEAVGFMEIPIEMAKSVVSIPSALLDFKVTNLGDEKKFLDAQASLISAQQALSKKQEELLDAQQAALEAATAN